MCGARAGLQGALIAAGLAGGQNDLSDDRRTDNGREVAKKSRALFGTVFISYFGVRRIYYLLFDDYHELYLRFTSHR